MNKKKRPKQKGTGAAGTAQRLAEQEEKTRAAKENFEKLCRWAKKAASEHRPFLVPNKFWSKENQTAAELKQSSLVYTKTFEAEHGFAKKPRSVPDGAPPPLKKSNQTYVAAGIQFELDEDVDSVDPEGQWLELGCWAELMTKYEKDLEDRELEKTAQLHISRFVTEHSNLDEKKKSTSLIKSFFNLKGGTPQAAANAPKKPGGKWSHTWVCTLGGEVNIFDAKDKDTPSTSGTKRFKTWLETHHPGVFAVIESHLPKKNSTVVGDEVIEYYSFLESWFGHLEYVAMCAVDDRPLSMGQSERFRSFCESLDARYRPPSSGTVCNRILMAINLSIQDKLIGLFRRLRIECGNQPFLGMQFDGWAAPNCKAMHLCVTVTFLDVGFEEVKLTADDVRSMELSKEDAEEKLSLLESRERAKLYLEEAVLTFEAFPKTRHLAHDIANHIKVVLARYELRVKDIRLATPDGGSNMLAAVKLLNLNRRYCYPHKLQRAILQGIGEDQNPGLAELEKKIDAVTHKTNTSYASRKAFEDAQRRGGAARPRSMVTSGKTRWSSMQRKIRRTNSLMKPLLDAFGDDNTIVQDWADRDDDGMDKELDALSDDGFSDTSSLDEADANGAEKDADEDDMVVDSPPGNKKEKLSEKFERRDNAFEDVVAALAGGNPANLVFTQVEQTTLLEMEGLLHLPELATTLLEGHKQQSGQSRRAMVEPHKALIVIRQTMKALESGHVAVFKECDATTSQAARTAARTPRLLRLCTPIVRRAHEGIYAGMQARFRDADQNQLINLLLDKGLNLRKLLAAQIVTQMELDRANTAFDGALERMKEGLVALEKNEWELKREERRALRETERRPATTQRNAGVFPSPRKRRTTTNDDDADGDVLALAGQRTQREAAREAAQQRSQVCLTALGLDEFEFDEDDEDEVIPQPSSPVEEEELKFVSQYDLDKEKRFLASIDPKLAQKNFKNADGKFDNYAFWCEHRNKVPIHTATFRCESPALCAQANTERTNSRATRILEPLRRSMASDNFAALMFCGTNFRLFDLDPDEIKAKYEELKKNKKSELSAVDDDVDDDDGDFDDGEPAT